MEEMAEERIDLGLDGDELDPPEPQQRPAPQRTEDDEDDDDEGGGGSDFWEKVGRVASALVVAIGLAAVVFISYAAYDNHRQISAIWQTLSANTNSIEIVRGIVVRLDSAKAERSDLESVKSSVSALTEVGKTLNNRVLQAEENLRKNGQAAAGASNTAKRASHLAQEARDQLAQLTADGRAQWVSTVRSLDTLRANLPREIDSRVGPVAVDLSTFQAKQGAVNTAQDSIITLIRAKTGLTDERMRRLAAAVKAKQKREAEKADKMKEREERRKKK